MMKARRCFHHCHGPIAVIFGVDVNNPWEAEAACDSCKSEHPQRNKQAFIPPVQWKPENDAKSEGDASGYGTE